MRVSESTSHLIKGAKVPSTGEEGIEVLNPATGEQIGYIPAARRCPAGHASPPPREPNS
jgi:acyl-CoA reductase-like NAD-dependent aldehyde dehydrogenase